MTSTPQQETFTHGQIIHAIGAFLAWGEEEFGKSQLGYFSGHGFAARVLRYHLNQLAGATPEAASLRAQIEQLPRTHKDYYDRPMCSADCDVPEHYNVTWADVLALLDATETTDGQ